MLLDTASLQVRFGSLIYLFPSQLSLASLLRRVYVMVMIRRIDGDRCWVTTVEEKKDLELDIYYPFFPINSFVVDDMTALPNLHEVGRDAENMNMYYSSLNQYD